MNSPLVSVIIPTKNSLKTLEACLKSVKEQSYKNIEIFVVDNSSTDNTKEIALKYTDKVFNIGPERSAQRNFGVQNSVGEYVVIVDSDMELSVGVIENCVNKIISDQLIKGIIIPEESFGVGFWAQCKKLEKSFYIGVDWMEAARFYKKDIFQEEGGFNENMVSGEDWDLSQRIGQKYKLDRINNLIYHNEGEIKLIQTIKKKLFYAGKFTNYVDKNKYNKEFKKQINLLSRYKLFFSQPKKLLKNPILGSGMLFMKICEFGFGGVGYLISKIKKI